MNIKLSSISSAHSMLYNQDYYLWLEMTVKKLRSQQLQELDIENLVEEIEAMGRSEKRELKSRLVVLLTHLLKWKYQQNKRTNSWLNTINEQRREINFILEDSPSLKSYLQDNLDHCYQLGIKEAARETTLNMDVFPMPFPFTLVDILDSDYLPE